MKRKRRTKAEIERIKSAMAELLAEDHPQTVRQVFYQLVSRGVIEKTEAEYKQTVCRLLTEMRKASELPFDWLADNTRWMRKPRTYDSLEEMLRATAETYRRALWSEQDVCIEAWCEKDALAEVLYEATAKWDVPLMVTRGFSSLTFAWEAAQEFKELGKPVYIYYVGDWDPSGVAAERDLEKKLREYAPDTEIHFERIAVTPSQIRELGLPTRPTKKTDSRAKGFNSQSVEVDAIPAGYLRELVESHIVQHIDAYRYEQLRTVEAEERKFLERFLCSLNNQEHVAETSHDRRE